MLWEEERNPAIIKLNTEGCLVLGHRDKAVFSSRREESVERQRMRVSQPQSTHQQGGCGYTTGRLNEAEQINHAKNLALCLLGLRFKGCILKDLD